MEKDIYRKVQEQLDQYSIGFPATESGVEIEILKLLFSEEEATLFSQMTGESETPRSVAKRIQRLREMEGVAGIHLMAIEWERKVPEILERAGLLPRPALAASESDSEG